MSHLKKTKNATIMFFIVMVTVTLLSILCIIN